MDHSIAGELSRHFEPHIRERGEGYYRRGRVHIAEASRERVLATVEGTRRYTVELLFAEGEARMACSCPYFLDFHTPCKHLWALILTLDRSSSLSDRLVNVSPADDKGSSGDAGGPRAASRAGLPEESRADRAEPVPDTSPPPPVQPVPPPWKRSLEALRWSGIGGRDWTRREAGEVRELWYVLDADWSRDNDSVLLLLYEAPRGGARTPTPIDPRGIRLDALGEPSDPDERDLLAILSERSFWSEQEWIPDGPPVEQRLLLPVYRLSGNAAGLLLPKMCRLGRCRFLSAEERGVHDEPIELDGGPDWELELSLGALPAAPGWGLRGRFARDGESILLSDATLLVRGGLFFAHARLSRYHADDRVDAWIEALGHRGRIQAEQPTLSEFLREILTVPDLPRLEMEDGVPLRVERGTPRPRLRIRPAESVGCSKAGGSLVGELSFDYGGRIAGGEDPPSGLLYEEEGLVLLRDGAAERSHQECLLTLGFREVHDSRVSRRVLKLAERRLPEVVRALLAEAWQVEADEKLYRRAGSIDIRITSGIDWFEARGGVDFDGQRLELPELLKALRHGKGTVRLGDGSVGLLPEEWLRRQGLALALGEPAGDAVRYRGHQALLIDALLADQPESSHDEGFDLFRKRIEGFDGVHALEPPAGFVGTLRDYQKEALGWFQFLDEFGFGGCLADDMGLGKTVQVLALLESVRTRSNAGESAGPAGRAATEERRAASLVVVPKSLVFNWRAEAARFTPGLKVLEYTGPDRGRDAGRFEDYDVVLTTYGTVRNDIAWMKAVVFDYVVLDEAQAIKNPAGATAKAARLLRARRRIALSGTPIENHLGELWSLFEFLNPGMLGGVSVFARNFAAGGGIDESASRLLARALRPFVLRRTKRQVAPELPEKIEQTLYCELSAPERRRYEELRRYYRSALDRQIRNDGLGRAKIHVLEALLRLRQAACDPGLLGSRARPGAKIELLLEQLEDVVAEGRKALVFSQFTALLAILRERLESARLPYEYLDGQTRDREARVRRFQDDPACPLFLISLKAGGLGLNLTAAEYVFILDPWWNPAVEAQAIDRTHRIGQDRTVFAYRLIAKDTVEEKVLQLQESKRKLAEAIITENNRLIGELSYEDLALLLS